MARDAVLTIAVTLGCGFVLLRDRLLPSKFDYDSLQIQALAQGRTAVNDGAFSAVASVYRWIGLAHLPLPAALLGYAAAIAVLLLVLRSTNFAGTSSVTIVISVAAVGLSSVYMASYSKELLVLPVVAVVSTVRGRKGFVLSVLAMAVYATEFRTYWWIVALLFCVFSVILPRLRRPSRLVAIVPLVLTALVVAYMAITGKELSLVRAGVNMVRAESADAVTQIGQYIGGGSMISEAANVIVIFTFLIIPLPLLLMGTPYHVLVGCGIAFLWLYVAVRISGLILRGHLRTSSLHRRASALLLAFVVTQALFEPDYGSALRHVVPLLGLVLCLSMDPANPRGPSMFVPKWSDPILGEEGADDAGTALIGGPEARVT